MMLRRRDRECPFATGFRRPHCPWTERRRAFAHEERIAADRTVPVAGRGSANALYRVGMRCSDTFCPRLNAMDGQEPRGHLRDVGRQRATVR